MVKTDFKIWILCGQEDTEALPRRKDARKWNPVGNGGTEVVVINIQLELMSIERIAKSAELLKRDKDFIFTYVHPQKMQKRKT